MPILPASFRSAILPAAFALCVGSVLAGQDSQPAQNSTDSAQSQTAPYTLRESVNRVVVDVVVTDANGKPVRGLTQQDFSIFEDGNPEGILSFDVYSLDGKPGYYNAKLPPLPPNTFVNIATAPERGPLYVVVLDLLNTEQNDQPYARQQMLKFIKEKPEGTRFAAFVLSDGLHLVQGFTADRDQLYAALDPAHTRPHVPRIFLFGANWGRGDTLQMSAVFKEIALYLDGLPGRKNIIWFSGRFPLDLFPHNDNRPDNRPESAEALDALARSESAIYPVDVTGVDPFPAGRMTGATPVQGTNAGVPGGPSGGSTPMPTSGPSMQGQTVALAGAASQSIYGDTVEDVIAEMTGGRAYYSRNDLTNMLEEATETGSNYYSLTYSPTDVNFDGKMRKIQVRVKDGQKYQLEYRRGYLASAPASPIMPVKYQPHKKNEDPLVVRPVGDSLAAYMQEGAPIARDVVFRAHVRALGKPQLATPMQMANLVDQPTYFRVRQRKRPNKPLAPVQLQAYQIEYQIIARLPHLEVAAGVYDGENRLLNGDVEEAFSGNSKIDDPNAKFTYFRVQQKLEVPVGSVRLRMGVRDASTDRMGTIEIPLPLAPES